MDLPAPRGVISIGTNSTRLLILEGDAVRAAESVGTRLGRGLGVGGRLDRSARDQTLAVVRDYTRTIAAADATIDIIATSALRRADDAADFVGDVLSIVGVVPRILSGDEEARYSFFGAISGPPPVGRLGVLDVGGGSTELAVGTAGAVERTISLEIGAVRLSERHPALLGERALAEAEREDVAAAARADARSILEPLAAFAGFADLRAVGGSVFTAAAMLVGDPRRDGVRIAALQRRKLIDDLLARDLAQRRAIPHIRPQRADILAAGLIIVDVACTLLAIDVLQVRHADLLAGYVGSPEYRAVRPRTDDGTREG